MTVRARLATVGAVCALVLAACSPAMNWRQVNLQTLQARLPCKPDSATRTVNLAGGPMEMQMMGCEADGALFAISHVRATDVAAATSALADWQTQALRALQAGPATPVTLPAAPWASTRVSLRAEGKNARGKPMQAQLSWWIRGTEIYHLAVYSEQLSDSITQAFLEDVHAQ
jgi:hypothetical protein